jgi:hypothetical protein
MSSLAIAVIALACSFGGAVLGIVLRAALPESHLSDESKEVIRLGTGFVGTMAALVLGLLVASATSAFNAEDSGFQQLATNYTLLDRALNYYGPEAEGAREKLRRSVDTVLDRLWPTGGPRSSGFSSPDITAAHEDLFASIRDLSPHNDAQRLIQTQAVQIGVELGKTRWGLSQGESSSIPAPFLVVLMFWVAALFTAFGLLAPRNATVVVVLLVCALSVAAAIFLILDLGQPFEGMIRVSSEPLREARSRLGR